MADDRRPSQPLSLPLVLSSTFAFERTEDEADAALTKREHLYTRWSNPTVNATQNSANTPTTSAGGVPSSASTCTLSPRTSTPTRQASSTSGSASHIDADA